MDRRRNNLSCHSNSITSDLDETFRFDSKACSKTSKRKTSKSKSRLDSSFSLNLELSQPTSEYVRYVEGNPNNIRELLEESEEEKTTLKNDKDSKSDLWDFFARFEKESNPDITISDIEIVPSKIKITRKQKEEPKQPGTGHTPEPARKRVSREKDRDTRALFSDANREERYPRRTRLQPLRYWLGERCVYKNGMIVDVIKK